MRHNKFYLIVLTLILLFFSGCSSLTNVDNNIAYISANANSQHENTFKDLDLGLIFDFNLKVMNADKSWVTVWIEGYKRGEKIEPFHLTELSYGLSPKKVEEGNLEFGIINPTTENEMFFITTPAGGKIGPHKVVNNPVTASGGVVWEYAIGSEQVALKADETKVIGVYRQVSSAIHTYDLYDSEQIKKLVDDSIAVLLVKIKIEELQ